jgi:chromosome segregation ATPase
MGTRTTPRPSRKRASPQPNESSDNDAATVKRRRSGEGDKENGQVNDRHPATRELTSPMAERAINVNAAGKPPEAGIIKSIYVENFMCHRKFTLDLCRNVNFIYGQNGSGKSAILAAIQICLGAGARRTRRARNLKDLVRKDATCNNAKIRVTLLNRGDDGYQHDIYGDSITVERTIALRGGYNGYKLYDSEMQERSRSKKDLDDMLDKLNIQVENPVAILDQEEAKKFLTGKAEDKYAFFMKATELERIDRTYACTIDKVFDLDEQSSRMNQGLEADMQLVKDTKLQYEQHQEIEKLEKKLRAFQEFYAWSRHKERNQLLVEQLEVSTVHEYKIKRCSVFSHFFLSVPALSRQHIQVFRDKAEKNKERLTQAEEAAQGPDDEEVVKRNKLDELSREAQEQSQMKKELEQDVKRATEPLKAVQRQLKFLKKEQASAAESLRRANKRLQAKRDEIVARAGSAESEEARRTLKLKEAEDNLAAAKESHAELKQAVSDAYRAYEELEPHVEQAKQNCRGAKGRLNAVESRIASLQSSSNNSLAMFGQKCTQVKQSVRQAYLQNCIKGKRS